MADIEVVIRKSQGADGNLQSAEAQAQPEKKPEKDQGKTSLQTKAVNGALIQVAKQAMTTSVQQFGNLTGDYTFARNVGYATGIASDIATIATLGPAGAVLVAGKHALDVATSFIEQRNKTIEQSFKNQALGQISSQGSRY